MAKEQSILTEAGTNEMELLVFRLSSTHFGINVATVREILQQSKTISIPCVPEEIEGSFKLRDQVLTLINLRRFFNIKTKQAHRANGTTIIVEFNNINCGILVDTVDKIYRLGWDKIQSPSQYLVNLKIPITSIVNIDEKVVLIVDFETVISKILGIPCVNLSKNEQTTKEPVSRKNARLLVVDDSSIVRKTLVRRLNQNGFENLTVCTNGQHAWETIETQRSETGKPFDLVLTDIEMPQMDGLHLTSKIKSDTELKDIPVVLFSSLITKGNFQKGKSVGADAQVNKPDSEGMLKAIETCLAKKETLITA